MRPVYSYTSCCKVFYVQDYKKLYQLPIDAQYTNFIYTDKEAVAPFRLSVKGCLRPDIHYVYI